MGWWYLSFASEEDEWLGASYVHAPTMQAAVQKAHTWGCNPGGEVLGAIVPDERMAKVPQDMRYRLLTLEEVEGFAGPTVKVSPDEIDQQEELYVSNQPGQEVCDFCFSDDTTWTFEAEDFDYPTDNIPAPDGAVRITGSSGNWAACTTCKNLIEDNKVAALLARGNASMWKRHPETPHVERRQHESLRKRIFHLFMEHRKGPAMPTAEMEDA